MLRKTLLASVIALSGCSLMQPQSTTISDLSTDTSPISDISLPRVSHKDVRDDYRELLKIVEDEELREQIERRIAGVYMLEGDHNQYVGTAPPKDGYFAPAIKSYNEVIDKYPQDVDNAESLYQLAKAYDLDGHEDKALSALDRFIKEYYVSPRLSEVYFRKGDILFRQGHYEDAEQAYQSVITIGKQSAFLNNSYYLLGWSRYKESDYDGGIQAFSEVLDRLIPDDGKVERLNKIDKSLVDDTLHIMSLSLAYSGGANKIRTFYSDRPQSAKYQWLLYNGLGEHFLEKERYEDSAASYREFVTQNPTSDRAPEMHSAMIRSYIDGEFSAQILPEKESYVQNYGINSSFWKTKEPSVKAKVIPTLKTYLEELAKHYHGTGQNLKKQIDDGEIGQSKLADAKQQQNQSFIKAADYYDQYMNTFPEDPRVPEMVYMRAEALFDGGNFEAAIPGYEQTAYQYKSVKYGADAGYAAIIAYQNHGERLKKEHGENSPQLMAWVEKSVNSQLQFVQTYRNDKRSASVLAKTSEEFFTLKRYDKALEVATGIIAEKGKIDDKLLRTVYGVIAHSQYELGNYAEAETGYRDQLKYIGKNEPDYEKVIDRMATTAYKQGEAALTAEDPQTAIKHFLRIKTIAPDSDIRVIAQFDAATHLLKLEEWDAALAELKELRRIFPKHKLASDVTQKIAYAYEQAGKLRQAADEYYAIYRNDKDENVRRDALFIAAELYEKAGDYEIAIDYFKRWAHAYEEPFDTRMEARYHLSQLYKKSDDMIRHLYWLRRIIDGDLEAGSRRTDRSKWLGALANAEYGDYWTWEFNRIRLRAPLDKWVPTKTEKLKNALSRYNKAANYGIPEISSRVSFSIGELYAKFAKELMESPYPKGLSGLEREQYALILEEQAIPFEELAIEIHQSNIDSAWEGHYDEWVAKSFTSMARLSPVRFDKQEIQVSYGDGIR